ncbi:MAG: hypothetical protein EZS28_034728 [Streblomastix strix]|uniref:Uncharacterized protein n=1 Tax=Streblomastix strix TaxID=222440 RepID=A0A5J4UJH0_9EUKA|nr:MAG: hypothetical protein EZS28_034728 [Streblomastix strix]
MLPNSFWYMQVVVSVILFFSTVVRASNWPFAGVVGMYILNALHYVDFSISWQSATWTIVVICIQTAIEIIRLIALILVVALSKYNTQYIKYIRGKTNKINTIFKYLFLIPFANGFMGAARCFSPISPLYGDQMKGMRITAIIISAIGFSLHLGIAFLDIGFNVDKRFRKGDILPLISPRIGGIIMTVISIIIYFSTVLKMTRQQHFFRPQGNALIASYIMWGAVASPIALILQFIPGIPKVYWQQANDPTTLLSSFTVVQMVAVGIPYLILASVLSIICFNLIVKLAKKYWAVREIKKRTK